MERRRSELIVGKSLEIDTDYYRDLIFTIDEFSNFLNTAEDNGATHIAISARFNDSVLNDICIQAVDVRTESDEEYKKRVTKEKHKLIEVANLKKSKRKGFVRGT